MTAIIYYSLSGKTHKQVHEKFEGDFYRLEGKIKIPRKYWMQLAYLGFFASFNFKLKYKPLDIPFEKYDHIVLASPVWAFTITPFMKKFLKHNHFKHKKVSLLVTHEGGPGKALKHYLRYIDRSNTVIETDAILLGHNYESKAK